MSRAPVALGLMCKPPRAGISKTRLAASIGAEAAARLSHAFLQDCARAAVKAAGSAHLDLHAFFRPADGARELTDILGAGLATHPCGCRRTWRDHDRGT